MKDELNKIIMIGVFFKLRLGDRDHTSLAIAMRWK